MGKIEIYVAAHKPIECTLPEHCKLIQVNAKANGEWPGCLHDSDGQDNISSKNPNYCELTALYSMWKNSKADINGLFHYRRFLGGAISSASCRPRRWFLRMFVMFKTQ